MKRVLVVDDREENLYLLRALLQGNGFAAQTARHGAEALVLARQEPPDLVISDLLMPVMDGYTLLRHWKADERLKALPFVVYTATYTEPKDEQLALDLGADAFILKPAEPEAFLARLRGLLAAAERGALLPARTPAEDDVTLAHEYGSLLVRKLEEKAAELEEANRALRADLALRAAAEAEARRLLGETDRARLALLSVLEDQRRAEASLREAGERLRLVVEGTGTGFWDWELASNRVSYSREWKRQLGYGPDEVGDDLDEWRRLTHPDDVESTLARVSAYLARPQGSFESEFRMRHKGGDSRWILNRATAVLGSSGKPERLLGMHLDITDRKRAEEALRERERQLSTLIANLPGLTYRCRNDPEYTTELVSDGIAELTGYPAAEFRAGSRHFGDLVHPDDQAQVWSAIQAAIAADRPYELTYRLCTASGQVKWAWERGRGVRDAAGAVTALEGFVSDVSERVQAEALVHALPRRLLAVQEEERRRIARELHDELGQILTATKLGLEALAARAPSAAAAELDFAPPLAALDRALAAVRSLAVDLRPSVLDDLGLVPALRWHVDRFARTVGLSAHLTATLEERPAPEVETVCFRVAQEALTNVARHAAAHQVWVELRREEGCLILAVRDDGRGFDLARAAAGESVGLAGMRERVALAGGELSVRSRPGAGTEIRASLPLPDPAAAEASGEATPR